MFKEALPKLGSKQRCPMVGDGLINYGTPRQWNTIPC